jgi:hypothetical protein
MQRQFPQANTPILDLSKYRMDSDSLLRSVISSVPQPPPAPTLPYDMSRLSDLSKLSSELLDSLAVEEEPDKNKPPPDFDSNTEASKKDLDKDIKSSNKSSGSILAMIFKIVPIGVNIAKRGKTISVGFKESAKGIMDLVINTALLTALIGIDSINFLFQYGVFLFKLLICAVQFIMNSPKCLFFYFIQLYVFIVIVILISICFLCDVFCMVKYFTGMSCVEGFLMLLQLLEVADKYIYSKASCHIIHYPDTVNDMCYNCSSMGDTTAFMNVLSRMFNYIFVDIPEKIGGSVGETITGIGHILSFLDIT